MSPSRWSCILALLGRRYPIQAATTTTRSIEVPALSPLLSININLFISGRSKYNNTRFCRSGRLYAVDRARRIPSKEWTEATNMLLDSLMKQLEKDKKSVQLSSRDNLYVEGFATRLFMKADKQERRGKANLKTAKTFYAASLFFEILHNFGDVPFDIEQKQKYAAWKAAEIRKALKKGSQPSVGLYASHKALSVSDGGYSGSELPSEELAESFPLEQSSSLGSENAAVQEQFPFSTTQSCDNQNDPKHNFDTADDPSASMTDDDETFHDCSEGADHTELSSSDSDSELDGSSSDPVVQGQDNQIVCRPIFDTADGPIMLTSNYTQQDANDDDQFFHDCSQEDGNSELLSSDFGSGLDGTITAPAVQEEFPFSTNPTLSFDTGAGPTMSPMSDCNQQDAIDDDQLFHDCSHLSSYSDSGLNNTINTPMDVQGLMYRPSAGEVVKAQKASRFAVSALASSDVSSAVLYLQQAIDLLTKHCPQHQ